MKLTREMMEKAKTAKSMQELLEMAKAENIELSAEEAEKAFAELHKTGELSDDELDNVAGGCGDDSESEETKEPVNKFNVGDRVYLTTGMHSATVVSFRYYCRTFVYDIKFDHSPFRDSMGKPVEILSYDEDRLQLM